MDNTTSQDMVDQLRQINEQLMKNLMNDFQLRRSNRKLKGNLKKSQAEAMEALKKQFAPTTDSSNSFLNNMLGKLFE